MDTGKKKILIAVVAAVVALVISAGVDYCLLGVGYKNILVQSLQRVIYMVLGAIYLSPFVKD